MLRPLFCLLLFVASVSCFGQTKPEGNVISAQGRVEYRAAALTAWVSVAPMQGLFVKDRLHTGSASKAAVLFRDETQIRLNANSELIVHSLSQKKGTSTAMELLQGEGWFRTKNPASDLHVETPGATAAIRGTEINLRIDPDGLSVLTVVEGQAEFSNEWGSVTVNEGEEASARPGEAPTKRLLLNPEDAVQWVIYYPTDVRWHDMLAYPLADRVRSGFSLLQAERFDEALDELLPLAAADGWARIGASIAYAGNGDYENAAAVLGEPLTGAVEVERLSQRAAVALETGDVAAAGGFLDAARAIDPAAPRPAALGVTLALAQNQKARAREIAAAALAAYPDSVTANVSAGEVAQADFDLVEALRLYDRALSIDATDVRALVDRARVLFGTGRAAEAGADAAAAARLSPQDAQVLSLQGFILLSLGRHAEAAESLTASTEADSSLGEPHLGLGLLAFKQGRTAGGLWEMLIATLLDPKVSLYQSYLGKAYVQLGRVQEGLAALDSAARLDPRDPTPRLYRSHFLRDLNRHVDALEELNAAIALNDNRAVYRSRLLLDQDFATKNVSLAQVYRKVGAEAWGVSEALTSLGTDFTNASAHLFLADLYADMPDRTQATQSEFLQYIIFAPVNQNSFSSFGEYTSLLEQPMFSISTYTEAATPSYRDVPPPAFYAMGEVSTKSGSDLFTHASLLHYRYQVGARPGVPDQFGFGDLQAKIALGLSADLFLHVTYNLADFGADDMEIVQYGTGSNAVNITQVSPVLNPGIGNTQNLLAVAAGARWEWTRGFPLVVVAQYQNNVADNVDPAVPSSVPGILLNSELELSTDLVDVQAQQILRLGDRWQVMLGMDGFQGTRHYVNPVTAYVEATGERLAWWTDSNDSSELGLHGWVWSETQIMPGIQLSAALFAQADRGTHLFTDQQYSYEQLYPAVGLSFDLGKGTVLRAAAYRFRSTRLFPETIYPSAIAGFLLDRNEEIYTLRTEGHLSLDVSRPPVFVTNHLYYRAIEYPPEALVLLTHADTLGLTSELNWLIARFLTASASNQVEATTTTPFDEISDQLETALTFTIPSGLTLQLRNTLLAQVFLRTAIPELGDSLVDVLDAEARFDFPRKRGYVSLAVTNLFDQSFTVFADALAVSSLSPYRRLTLSLDLEL